MLWRQQTPWHDDAPRVDELFPSASYQYVLYGMGFRPTFDVENASSLDESRARADRLFHDTRTKSERVAKVLPDNRTLLCSILQRPTG